MVECQGPRSTISLTTLDKLVSLVFINQKKKIVNMLQKQVKY